MRSRTLRLLFILLWSVWFGLIIPGHERGVVRLPGSPAPLGAAEADLTCDVTEVMSGNAHCCRQSSSTPDRDPVRSCALCKLVAMMDVPPAVNNDVPPLGLLGELDLVVPQRSAAAPRLALPFGRAPPQG